jgi:hypothetical protein
MNESSTGLGQDSKAIAIIAVILVAIVGGGIWWYSRSTTPANATPKVVTATEAPIDNKAPAPPVNLPPLDQMDSFLKPMLQALSNRPELAKWLATDDLVRQLAMAIDQAAAGGSPARDFKVLAPSSPFVAARRGNKRIVDPAGYKRYDGLVQTVTSIDASKVANIYKTIRPRLNEAYQQAGNPGRNVDSALVAALDILIDTPVVKDPVELIETGGAGWAYNDDDLEALHPTQKQLLRMGPANVDRLLVWLRALRDAL